ncbi:tetratricopeptide repeat protein [Humisphaera borealis]|uniref:Tetratricopeptide repeat protein n=1 Tax=Humisphaera borealis TaxID=2807512 RepID=A0A7M2WVA1_9BACT|nr:tetratricopeptide repeat protein [Humisphaera borealis]QOV89353.1 tetratricopeptide repeat protein [Humisphaera borealis]
MSNASDRLTKLQAMLERQPGDTFTLYAIGLEYKKAGDHERAIEHLDKVIQFDPGYCYAYYQKGQILETVGDIDAAKTVYQAGIASARAKGDAHALSELQGALQMIE